MKHVLIVDRSHTIRAICKTALENGGHKVLIATTSMYALKQLPMLKPPPDVLLLGVREDSIDIDNQGLLLYLKRCVPRCRCILLVRPDILLPSWANEYEVLLTPFLSQRLLDRVNAPMGQEVR